jgi:hypothetical protein
VLPRRLLPVAAFVAVLGAMGAGCTFLIGFDDVPAAADGGTDAQTPIGPPDVRVDVSSAPDSGTDVGPDARDALANPDACKGKLDGKYCGGNTIVWPGDKDDLVTCKANVVSDVRLCSSGVGCIRMLNGYPDQCDECGSKADGTYCGRDMTGWDPKNADTRVRCQNKAEVGLLLCAAGCSSIGATSVCK